MAGRYFNIDIKPKKYILKNHREVFLILREMLVLTKGNFPEVFKIQWF